MFGVVIAFFKNLFKKEKCDHTYWVETIVPSCMFFLISEWSSINWSNDIAQIKLWRSQGYTHAYMATSTFSCRYCGFKRNTVHKLVNPFQMTEELNTKINDRMLKQLDKYFPPNGQIT